MSRSRSSGPPPPAASSPGPSGADASPPRGAWPHRRVPAHRWTARLRAVVVSHARGPAGNAVARPALGARSRRRPGRHSSARSQSPSQPDEGGDDLPPVLAERPGRRPRRPPRSRPGQRPDLDGAVAWRRDAGRRPRAPRRGPRPRAGRTRRSPLGVGERSVGGQRLVAPHPDGRGVSGCRGGRARRDARGSEFSVW